MRYGTFLASLLGSAVWLFVCSSCDKSTVSERELIVSKYDLLEAINNSQIQFTLPDVVIDALKFDGTGLDNYDSASIKKYKLGNDPTKSDSFNLLVPASIPGNDKVKTGAFISFIATDKTQPINWDNFANTARYCEDVFCGEKNHHTLSINAYTLFEDYLKRLESGSGGFKVDGLNSASTIAGLEREVKIVEIILKCEIERGVMPNFHVFIPDHLTVYDFIRKCASKVKQTEDATKKTMLESEGYINEFFRAVIDECSTTMSADLQQISWKRILEEIQSYCFIPSKDTDFLQLLTTEQIRTLSAVKLDCEKLNVSTGLYVFKKLSIQLSGVVLPDTKPTTLDTFRSAIDFKLSYDGILGAHIKADVIRCFPELTATINLKENVLYFNLSTIPSTEFKLVTCLKVDFDKMVKDELKGKKFILELDKYKEIEISADSIVAREEGDLIIFPKYPIIEEIPETEKLLIRYVRFAKRFLDSTKDNANVTKQLQKILWAKETMEAYKKYLEETPVYPKTSKTSLKSVSDLKSDDGNEEKEQEEEDKVPSTKKNSKFIWIVFIIVVVGSLGLISVLIGTFYIRKRNGKNKQQNFK